MDELTYLFNSIDYDLFYCCESLNERFSVRHIR